MTSITFRPTQKEFDEYKDLFLKRFIKKYGKHDYLVSPESASSQNPNHYQIFLDIDKRPDSVKRAIKNVILKDCEITNFNIAVKVKKIKTNYTGVIGYCMKEIDDIDVITSNISPTLLIQYRDEYRKLSLDKKVDVDRCRVNLRNIHICFKNYWNINRLRLIDEITNYVDDDECNYSDGLFSLNAVKYVLTSMIQNEYQCFNILISKDFDKICRLIQGFMNDNLYDAIVG